MPPRQIYATLLDEGRYVCHWRTMYRILMEHREVRERRNPLRHPPYKKPELLATGGQSAMVMGHHQAPGPAEMDVNLPLRDHGCL